MPIPTNRMSYKDIYEVYDRALDDPKGIRLPFDSLADAKNYQMRMHNARAIDRRESRRTYREDDPMHGQSIYDVLQVRVRHGEDGTVFLYVEPKDKGAPEIELLSEVEAEDNTDA
jgi:hypothetical protein